MGYERLEEIENPEIATKRMREIYKQKGYSDEWIEKRARGIAVRDELTKEWKKRGVKEHLEYAILTSEISKATFGMTTREHHADSSGFARMPEIAASVWQAVDIVQAFCGCARAGECARDFWF